jgi:hypothetical protein
LKSGISVLPKYSKRIDKLEELEPLKKRALRQLARTLASKIRKVNIAAQDT